MGAYFNFKPICLSLSLSLALFQLIWNHPFPFLLRFSALAYPTLQQDLEGALLRLRSAMGGPILEAEVTRGDLFKYRASKGLTVLWLC